MQEPRSATDPQPCLHDLFALRAREFPHRVAVRCGVRELTYRELDARSTALARRLRRSGVAPDTIVGLCIDRSLDLIVGLLGILKAGGAYLPIDPAYPTDRIRYLLEDSGTHLMVTTDRTVGRLQGMPANLIDVNAEAVPETLEPATPSPGTLTPANLAYVIYTSGSTGAPKGVLVEHRQVLRLFRTTAERFHFDEHDRWSLFHSASFDFSVWEIWGALLYGGRLVVVPEDVTRSPARFLSLLEEEGITVLNQTPSAFRQLVPEVRRRQTPKLTLRLVMFGGEALEVNTLAPWIERRGDQTPELFNLYGITEITVHGTWRRIRTADLETGGPSPIGNALPDLHIELLDERGRAIEDDRPGEIHITGPGLARGYLHRPRLTAERFLPAERPGCPGARRYRSGDRGRRTKDGELLYLGRLDDQLKIRGFRIEPGEVEAGLSAHPEVEQAIVVPQDFGEGDLRLVAYLLPVATQRDEAGLTALISSLSRSAARTLPPHLLPSDYRVIAQVPLTPQGKVDRRALAEVRTCSRRGTVDTETVTETERVVRGIVEEILQKPGVPVNGDLFDLGATSLAIVRILRRAGEVFGVPLNGSELVDEASIARLALSIDALSRGQALSSSGESP